MFPGLAGAGSSLEATLPSLGRGDGRNQQLNLMKSYSQNIRRWLALATVVAVQTRDNLSTGNWADVGSPTNERTATVPRQGPIMFVRVVGQ